MSSNLTATSHAILGLLAIRPWTTYELTQQMKRSLNRFWPRAESKLYEEPRRLAASGLARATSDRVGRRPRTRYSINPAGRRELATWLSEPSAPPALECEHLLKVFFAEHGSKADLLATLAGLGAWAHDRLVEDAEIADSYLGGTGRFPERTAQLALVGRYISDYAEMTRRWADWATDVVQAWPDEVTDATPSLEALQVIVDRRPAGANP
jgi:DNA-binding PadR family transcriptional regulator